MDNNKQRELFHSLINKPKHKGLTEEQTKDTIDAIIDECDDIYHIHISIDSNGIVSIARYDGNGCSISEAATEAFLSVIEGKSIDYIKDLINRYESFINGDTDDIDEEVLNVFKIVQTHVSRKKCALLVSDTIKEIINR